jgi:hypothetical protein
MPAEENQSGVASSSEVGVVADELTPEGWTKQWSKSQNRHYYYRLRTNTSLWSVAEVKELVSKEEGEGSHKRVKLSPSTTTTNGESQEKKEQPRLAIIVPFRDLHPAQDRAKHLAAFLPHMQKFLSKDVGLDRFRVYVVEQSDDGRKFNRGKLLNVGFKIACEEGFDTFTFHDVDLLPQKILAPYYGRPLGEGDGPLHVARCWDRYNESMIYMGGIVSFSRRDFEALHGFPNIYWGWGGEDDELSERVRIAGLPVDGPPRDLPDAIVDLEEMNLVEKLQFLRENKDWKCNMKFEVNDEHALVRRELASGKRSGFPRWWGFENAEYKIVARKDAAQGVPSTSIVTVDLAPNSEDQDGKILHWTDNAKDPSPPSSTTSLKN